MCIVFGDALLFPLSARRGIAVDHEGDELYDDGAAIDHAGSIGREMVDYRHYYWPTINRSAFIVTDKSGRHCDGSLFPRIGLGRPTKGEADNAAFRCRPRRL